LADTKQSPEVLGYFSSITSTSRNVGLSWIWIPRRIWRSTTTAVPAPAKLLLSVGFEALSSRVSVLTYLQTSELRPTPNTGRIWLPTASPTPTALRLRSGEFLNPHEPRLDSYYSCSLLHSNTVDTTACHQTSLSMEDPVRS
jgi:hypothetical protein